VELRQESDLSRDQLESAARRILKPESTRIASTNYPSIRRFQQVAMIRREPCATKLASLFDRCRPAETSQGRQHRPFMIIARRSRIEKSLPLHFLAHESNFAPGTTPGNKDSSQGRERRGVIALPRGAAVARGRDVIRYCTQGTRSRAIRPPTGG
jgi:hypothetical protein